MDLSWNSLEAKPTEGRKMGGRGGKEEREEEVGIGRGKGMFPPALYECPSSGPEVAAVCQWQMLPGLFLAKCLGNLSLWGSGMEKTTTKQNKACSACLLEIFKAR